MTEITEQILVEPEQLEKAVENVRLEALATKEAAITTQAKARVEKDLGPLPEPIELKSESKGLTLKEIHEGLKGLAPDTREKLTRELIAQYYGIDKVTKNKSLEQAVSGYGKHIDTYIRMINEYCEHNNLSKGQNHLEILTEEALIDEKDALIYTAAIRKIDKALYKQELRSLKDIRDSDRGFPFVILGAISSLGLSLPTTIATMNAYPILIGCLTALTITIANEINKRLTFPLNSKGVAAYQKEVAKHIQKYGQTLEQDLDIATEYAQKLQKQLETATQGTTTLNSSDLVTTAKRQFLTGYLPIAIETLTKLKGTYKE